MKRALMVLMGIVLINWSVRAWGHYPEGVTFLAFQWPPGQEPVMDGDLSEWEVVPDAYILNTQDGYEGVYGAPIFYEMLSPLEAPIFNQFAVVWTSWSDAENGLYIAARVFDNEHFIGGHLSDKPWVRIWQGDYFNITVDADHSAGPYALPYSSKPFDEEGKIKREFWDIYGVQATTYISSQSAPERLGAVTAATWAADPPWFEGGWDYRGRVDLERLTSYEQRKLKEYGERDWLATDWRVQGWWEQRVKEVGASSLISQWNVTTYELKIVPFDRLDWRGPGVSLVIVHDLEEAQIIGLNYGFYDRESKDGGLYRTILPYGDSYWDATFLSDFLLASVDEGISHTSLESSTWGRIKASFRQ